MKILHTADLHLREAGDERWAALQSILRLGRAEEADLMVVCGDLFDRQTDAEHLRVPLREMFSDTGFPVLLMPGNHDRESYGGRYFGSSVQVLDGSEPVEVGDCTVAALPFEPIQGEEIVGRLLALNESFAAAETAVLLYHGELLDAVDFGRSRLDFGDEGAGRYMPVKLSYFEGIGVDYVLAGHFHSNFDVWPLPDGGRFVYPGSPVSVTRRETGRRAVNLLSVGAEPDDHPLETFHYEDVTIALDPFSEADPVRLVEQRLAEVAECAEPLLRVEGGVNARALGQTEAELVERMRQVAAGCHDPTFAFRDVSTVVESDLFREFRERARAGAEPGELRPLLQMAIRAMMEAGL